MEVIQITRNDRTKKGLINEDKIRADIERYRHLMNFHVDPRAAFHLDTTKVAYPQHRSRLEAWMRGERVAPITVDMALTQKCSFSCTYCYAGLQYNQAAPADWQTYKDLLDDFISIGHAPGECVKGVSLVSDGESTESPYFYDFISYGKSLGIDMATGTNGYKLDPARFPELLKSLTYLRFNISAGEREAFKTVMGVKDKHWDVCMHNISEAVRVKKSLGLSVTIGLQMVLLPEYADQVIPLAILGREMGVDYTVIKHCSDDENGSLGVDYSFYRSELAMDLLKAAEALSTPEYSVQAKWSKMMTGRDRKYSKCFGTPLMLQMSGTCIVAPCGSFFSQEYSRYHIGNIKETRFKDLWEGERYWEVLNYLASDKFDPRKRCATLCLQDKVNEALFEWKELGKPIPDTRGLPMPMHQNFI